MCGSLSQTLSCLQQLHLDTGLKRDCIHLISSTYKVLLKPSLQPMQEMAPLQKPASKSQRKGVLASCMRVETQGRGMMCALSRQSRGDSLLMFVTRPVFQLSISWLKEVAPWNMSASKSTASAVIWAQSSAGADAGKVGTYSTCPSVGQCSSYRYLG